MVRILFTAFLLFSQMSLADSSMLYLVPPPPTEKRSPDLYLMRDIKKPSSKRLVESEVDGDYLITAHYIAYVKKGRMYVITDFENLSRNEIASDVVEIFKGPNSELFFEIVTLKPIYKRELNYITDLVYFKKNNVNSGYSSFKLQY